MKSLMEIVGKNFPKLTLLGIHSGDTVPNLFQNIPEELVGRCFFIEQSQKTAPLFRNGERANKEILRYTIFDGSRTQLYFGNDIISPSFYEPDVEFQALFFSPAGREKALEIDTTRLDDVKEIDCPIDCVNLSVPGAEGVIFKFGKALLKNVLVVEFNVLLLPLFKMAQLRNDSEGELLAQGFFFHRTLSSQGLPLLPFRRHGKTSPYFSQPISQKVVFLRNWAELCSERTNPDSLLKTALVLHDQYKSVDLAHYFLTIYDHKCETSLAPIYADHLRFIGSPFILNQVKYKQITPQKAVSGLPGSNGTQGNKIKKQTDSSGKEGKNLQPFIWLASYPRSGNTFLRTILWHCFGQKSASIYPKDLGGKIELESHVGHIEHQNGRIHFPENNLKLVKTHGISKDDRKAIYVVRDGRAACASFLEFWKRTLSLDTIIKGEHRFGSWSGNVNSWEPWNRENVLLIKYEDLRDDLDSSLERISDFLGIPLLGRTIPTRDEIASTDGQWVRKRSNWQDTFTEAQKLLFWELHGATMTRLGYEADCTN